MNPYNFQKMHSYQIHLHNPSHVYNYYNQIETQIKVKIQLLQSIYNIHT